MSKRKRPTIESLERDIENLYDLRYSLNSKLYELALEQPGYVYRVELLERDLQSYKKRNKPTEHVEECLEIARAALEDAKRDYKEIEILDLDCQAAFHIHVSRLEAMLLTLRKKALDKKVLASIKKEGSPYSALSNSSRMYYILKQLPAGREFTRVGTREEMRKAFLNPGQSDRTFDKLRKDGHIVHTGEKGRYGRKIFKLNNN